ncbi:hypothetical protein ACHHYP_13377 [Achlya hypogyna]|uniref:C2H2-type domain-containing protein n=1 Tax=Achlya hypogyna TaxID=1202772 RepID=A0A1V9YFB5_ACHHY|nr:hypothetical protein ACHHYP_13377 [Achlya hypogyna]
MHATKPSSDSMMSPERRFGCHIPGCGKRFKRKFTLQEHLNTHTGARPYVCDYEGCQRCFSTHGNLNRHKFIHTGEKPFGCTTCLKRFCTKEKLVRHVKTHTNNLRSTIAPEMLFMRKASTTTDDESDASDHSAVATPLPTTSASEYCFDDEFMSSNIHDEILLALQSLDVEPTPVQPADVAMAALWAEEPAMALKKPEELEQFPAATWNFEDFEDLHTIKTEATWFVPEPFTQMV